ncbi:ultraviolet-B receptor UVR8 [Tanacetum coccineum]
MNICTTCSRSPKTISSLSVKSWENAWIWDLMYCGHYGLGEHGEQVYGFGSGKHVQLGISNKKVKSINLLQSVYGLNEVNVSSIIANGDHSASLSADGHLYTWGRGFGTPDVGCPNHVILLFSFTHAALGWNHALVLTDRREVLMLGGHHAVNNTQKEILMNQDPNEVWVEKIDDLDGIKVVGVASGKHSGNDMGMGEHGQLGLGDTSDQTRPLVVNMG